MIKLPYDVGQDIKIYIAQNYPANSETVIGGGIGQELANGDVFNALKPVILDPISALRTEQYVKLYLKNVSPESVWQVMMYLSPTVGTWAFAPEKTKNTTTTSYTIGSAFPSEILAHDFVIATSLSESILITNQLQPNETIAIWIRCVISYFQLVTSPFSEIACPVVVVYSKVI